MKEEKKKILLDCIDAYFGEHGTAPTVRDVSAGTGIPLATVHRYLTEMAECGTVRYEGRRSVRTARMEMEARHAPMPVLGYVACGPGEEEEERVLEYIRMPQSLIGTGDFFALIAKGESMVGAGVCPGDVVIVDRDRAPKVGDVVVALLDGKNNLKRLAEGVRPGTFILRSENPDKQKYADIPVEGDLSIQGVAVAVTHRF